MSKRRDTVDDLARDWIAVKERDEPTAFAAWRYFRRDVLGSKVQAANKAFTVPSLLPPSDRVGVNAYVAAIKAVRASIGWS